MNTTDYQKQISDFEAHYKYDSTYMRELLEYSPEGFTKFNNFMPLASHREKLSPEVYWTVKLAAMQVEDCGECLQLNVRFALEGGLSKQLVETILYSSDELPENLKDAYDFARNIAALTPADNALVERIETLYDKGALLEIGLCIASAKMFPTIKRTLGYAKSCSLIDIEI